MFEEFMGTKEVSERHRFDTEALDAYLRQHVEGYPQGQLKVEQFKGGQSNPTFKLSVGGQQYVLRTKPAPAAKLLPSAHAIEREYRVMDALNKAGFPAARQYCLCMDEDVIGRAFYVMQFVEGRVLWDQSLPGMTPTERAAIYDELNRVIAQLHTIDYNAIGLGLLMAEAIFAAEGAHCIPLGVQTPLPDIVEGARAMQADIVALSFSTTMNPRHVSDSLRELRARLPEQAEIWAGGSNSALRKRPPGYVTVCELGDLSLAVTEWRQRQRQALS